VEDSWAPSYGANGGTTPATQWVDLTPRTRYQTSLKRGKQYELDQVQAGELQITLNNTDGALDPLNGAGPWGGVIRPYQPFKHRMQNSATANRLLQTIATGGEGYSAGAIPSAFGITSGTDGTGGQIVALGAGVAFEESNAFQFSVGTQGGAATICVFDTGGIVPGQPYTFSLYARNVTASTSVPVAAQIGWYGTASATSPTSYSVSSPVTLTGGGAWQRITVTGTAPATLYGARAGLALTGSGYAGSTASIQIDGQQLEKGSAATAWVYPGSWYGQFAGFVERWTPQYADAGTRAEAAITAVDAFALFSQRTLSDPLTEEFNLLSPRFLYKLNDPQGTTSATDFTGQNRAAPVQGSVAGAAPYAFGTAITSRTAGGTFYGSDTVLTLSNPSPGIDSGVSGTSVPTSYLALNGAGIKGPANPNLWTRVVAFRSAVTIGGSGSGHASHLWFACDNSVASGVPSGAGIDVYMNDNGMWWAGGSNAHNAAFTMAFAGATAPTDGNWHLAVFGMDAANNVMLASLDGVTASSTSSVAWAGNVPAGLVSDSVGALVSQGMGNYANMSFEGDIAFVAEFPSLLTASQISNLYTAWRNAGTGDSTDQRYARILRYVGYTGPTSLDSGTTRSMGPADFAGSDALSALQSVVDTETGAHWIQGTGAPRFRSRQSKYTQLTPSLTFGDGSGEIPYEDIQLDFDPAHLANVVQVTQSSTGQVFSAQDQTSIANYFSRLLTRSVNTTSAAECQDCASYLLSRYKNPLMRVSAIKVNVSASNAWSTLLPLDLGTRIRVMRRPLGCPPIQLDCFVEQIQWDYDSVGNATLAMQLSPADPVPSAIFGIWRTTLASSVSLGATSMTINAPTFDNQTPLAGQIGVGQQIVVGTGGAVPEVMTVKAVSATSPGWTTGVVTFTAPTAHSHTAGFNVTENLSTPLTTTTVYNTWDAAAIANSVNFAY
jgi:hypothetical protein